MIRTTMNHEYKKSLLMRSIMFAAHLFIVLHIDSSLYLYSVYCYCRSIVSLEYTNNN